MSRSIDIRRGDNGKDRKGGMDMNKYRIKQVEHCGHKAFCLQKKSLLGFWYNPDNFDGCITGWHDTIADANAAYTRKVTPKVVRFVQVAPVAF